jgi:prepilin-type N-terminal cleavage/methylation domain-containing protein/prepilin-type processing-associated H-X9-DG protein
MQAIAQEKQKVALMPPARNRNRRPGMTLIELLVVIAIIGVLIGLLLPAVQKVRAAAARIRCGNNMKQLALAMHQYHDARGSFPVGLVVVDTSTGGYSGGTNLFVEVLPYLEQDNLKRKWDYNDYRNNETGGLNATTAQVLPILVCPADALPSPPECYLQYGWVNATFALGSYGGNGGKLSFDGVLDPPASCDGVFFKSRQVRMADITDGLSSTLLLGERYHRDAEFDRLTLALDPGMYPLGSWGAWASAAFQWGSQADVLLGAPVPINYRVPAGSGSGDFSWEEYRLCAYGSGHGQGANFAFADGSVRFVSDSIALGTLQALSTRAGCEVVSIP